jgi:hypothetical protein
MRREGVGGEWEEDLNGSPAAKSGGRTWSERVWRLTVFAIYRHCSKYEFQVYRLTATVYYEYFETASRCYSAIDIDENPSQLLYIVPWGPYMSYCKNISSQ